MEENKNTNEKWVADGKGRPVRWYRENENSEWKKDGWTSSDYIGIIIFAIIVIKIITKFL